MTQHDTTSPDQSGEEKQAELQRHEQSFPPELGDRAGKPRVWTLSRIESVIGSIA